MQIVRNWNGEIEKNTGDGIMAIFGTETRDSKIIARDVIECAMAIKYMMVNDIQQKLIELNLPIMSFRIGIDMGQLLIAKIGIHTYNFLTAVGSAANRASKLQSLAGSNGICIGHNLFSNLHNSLWKFCEVGDDSSWKWIMGNLPVPYRFYHCLLEWPPPRDWIISLIRKKGYFD
jgi:class 3 adenylate cyclase